jgi:hypothetical protein
VEPPWRPPNRDKLMSKRLAWLFARDDQFMKESGDEGNLGSDPFISGQDGGVEDLKVTVGSQEGDKATVFADFRSLREQVRVEFAMVRENGRWVIDDITNTVDKHSFKVGDLLSQPYVWRDNLDRNRASIRTAKSSRGFRMIDASRQEHKGFVCRGASIKFGR